MEEQEIKRIKNDAKKIFLMCFIFTLWFFKLLIDNEIL